LGRFGMTLELGWGDRIVVGTEGKKQITKTRVSTAGGEQTGRGGEGGRPAYGAVLPRASMLAVFGSHVRGEGFMERLGGEGRGRRSGAFSSRRVFGERKPGSDRDGPTRLPSELLKESCCWLFALVRTSKPFDIDERLDLLIATAANGKNHVPRRRSGPRARFGQPERPQEGQARYAAVHSRSRRGLARKNPDHGRS